MDESAGRWSFDPILAAAARMHGFPAPWWVAGGWAIDLFLGQVTRRHADIEIGIYRRDRQALGDQLPGWRFEKAIPGGAGANWQPWEPGEELIPPVHQIRATSPDDLGLEIDFLLNERSDTHWVSRRHADLERPIDEVQVVGALGLPILAPEIQLYFKAKETRPKDQADFAQTLPRLSRPQTKWLAGALERYFPGHLWLEAIKRQRG